jgi:uncharacterized delta-60 repeat protein
VNVTQRDCRRDALLPIACKTRVLPTRAGRGRRRPGHPRRHRHPSYLLITARSQRAAAAASLTAFGREVQALNAFDGNGLVTEQTVLGIGANLPDLFAAAGTIQAAAAPSIQRDVTASYTGRVISYSLGEATVGTTPGTVYPGNVSDRRTSAPWVGLAVFTSSGDCVGVRFSRSTSEQVTMPGDAIACTGATALIGAAVTGSPAAPDTPAAPGSGTGTPAPSPSASTPAAQPAPVLTGAATDGVVALSWPAVSGAVTYTVYRDGRQIHQGTGLSFTDTTVVNGTAYVYTATATGTTATSARSAAITVTPAGAPAAPTDVTTEAGNKAVRVTWTATTGTAAAPVTGYRVYVDGVQAWQGADTTVLLEQLVNGTGYAFTVTTIGSGGESAQSTAVQDTPVDVAGTPALTVFAGDGRAVITWPAADRAKSYEIFRDGRSVWKGTALAWTDNNLTNGTRYAYTAVASGSGGVSLESEPVEIVPVTSPAVPAGLTVTTGAGMLKAAWTRVDGSAAAPVTGYRVYVDGVQVQTVEDNRADIDRLTNGTQYTITVTAIGPGGESAQSTGRTGTPAASPAAPSGLTGYATSGTVALTWGAVATSAYAPVTGYEVFQDGVSLGTQTGTTRTITGLTNGTQYAFTVRTNGPAADSPQTGAVKITPAGAPSTPNTPSVTAGNSSLQVSWTAVTSTTAGPVTGYRVYVNGVQQAEPSATNTTLANLVNGTSYTITVSACGPGGESAQSTGRTGTPITTPTAPAGVTAVASNGQVVLNWNTVASTTSAPVTGYDVYRDGLRITSGSITATTYTATGLTNGTQYAFTVRTMGTSGQSGPSSTVNATPVTTPAAPAGLTAAAGDQKVSLTWNAVASTGAAPVTGYRVSMNGTQVYEGTATSFDATGLTNGTSYTFTVVAYGTGGPSDASSVAGTPAAAGPSTGFLDTTFGSGGKVITPIGTSIDQSRAVAVQSDGKIVLAGQASNGSNYDFAIARNNTDGSPDTTFGTGGKVTIGFYAGASDGAYAVAVQSDGKIIAAGYATNTSNMSDFAMVRYNANGTLDTTFGTGGKVITAFGSTDEYINSIAVQADGKIVVTGYYGNGSWWNIATARYTTTGVLDTTFGSGGKVYTTIASQNEFGYAVAVQSDGKILVTGYAYVGTTNDIAMIRYNTNGTLDTTFGSNGKVTTAVGTSDDIGYAVKTQADGKILVGGSSIAGGWQRYTVVRYNTNGTLDTTYGTGGKVVLTIGSGHDVLRTLAVQPDGKAVVAGWATGATNSNDIAVARLNTNGTLDTSFGNAGKVLVDIGTGSNDFGYGAVVQPDGKIVVGGSTNAPGNWDFAAIRLK